jgi:hypothetical protein
MGLAFVCADRETGRLVTTLGYPTNKIAMPLNRQISNMFG